MPSLDQMVINAKVANALLHARHALDCLQYCTLQVDGGSFQVENRREIEMINDALKLIGVDPTEIAVINLPRQEQ